MVVVSPETGALHSTTGSRFRGTTALVYVVWEISWRRARGVHGSTAWDPDRTRARCTPTRRGVGVTGPLLEVAATRRLTWVLIPNPSVTVTLT